MKHIKLPIDFSDLLKGKGKKECSLEESIAQYIMMLIISRYGEVAGKDDFGSDIWELEFNQLVKIYEWEEKVRLSLVHAITKYEKRLSDIKVVVSLSEVDTDVDSKTYSQIRRKAIIGVSGNIVQTGVPFSFDTSIYVSPLSQ
ncbi:GPW/gp25 family protein [Aquimarina algiphila]|uniref:GPW/gp25 family protein n=1 Tax=Aquimarina algiphila TaxID=2047982 RepID=UPI00232BE6E9|nr:GPW/gp25 family protein [Aquimarina algiphila]